MEFNKQPMELYGRHFLANIALPENSPGGLFMINRDPRKQPRKPDVYVGIVEEVGPKCLLVKTGDRVSFRRWEYQHLDVDDERVVARERELVILNGDIPAPGMIVVKVIENKVNTKLIVPQTVSSTGSSPSIKGEILAFSPYGMGWLKEYLEIGKIIIFQKSRDDQWRYPDGKMVLKISRFFEICAIADKCPVCGDAHTDHHSHWEEAHAVQAV